MVATGPRASPQSFTPSEVVLLPDNIIAAAPTDVLPAGLCSVFHEEHRIEAFINSYQDGRSDRAALALNPRRFWKMTRRLTTTQYSALYTFYSNHLVAPFWFYHFPETVPPYSWDGTGAATDGRYAVVFDGSWSEQVKTGRSDVSFGLREVL